MKIKNLIFSIFCFIINIFVISYEDKKILKEFPTYLVIATIAAVVFSFLFVFGFFAIVLFLIPTNYGLLLSIIIAFIIIVFIIINIIISKN